MRLIDADKIPTLFVGTSHEWHGMELQLMARDLPTVDAIPIEWIKKYRKGNELVDLDLMLEDWRRENDG